MHQFYDACILGGGDRMLVCAALGQYEAGIIRTYMNSQQARHFVAWGFSSFHFYPLNDIAVQTNGVWRWQGSKTEMHRYVRRYFESRREDG